MHRFFDDEASEDDEDEDDDLSDEELHAHKKPPTEHMDELFKQKTSQIDYLNRFEGKSASQVNAYYNSEVHKHRQREEQMPSTTDPKIFVVHVKPKLEENMAYRILNKAAHLAKTEKKVTIVSALAMKKFPGKLFLEAFEERHIRESLEGFVDLNLGKIVAFDSESYGHLFSERGEKSAGFAKG